MRPAFVSSRSLPRHGDWAALAAVAGQCLLSAVPVGYSLALPDDYDPAAWRFARDVNRTASRQFGRPLDATSFGLLYTAIALAQGLGAIIAALTLVGPLSRRYGTKFALCALSNVPLVLGSLATTVGADAWWCLIGGRLLLGAHSGLALALAPLYAYACSRPAVFGRIGCLLHVGVALGGALAAAAGMVTEQLSDDSAGFAQWLFAVPALFGLVQIALCPCVPDAPVDLLAGDRLAEARLSIRFYYGATAARDDEAMRRLQRPTVSSSVTVATLFTHRSSRRLIALTSVLQACQSFAGLPAMVAYMSHSLRVLGAPQAVVNALPALVALFSAVCTIVAIGLVDELGRRACTLGSLTACTLLLAAAFAASLAADQLGAPHAACAWSLLAAGALYLLAYNVGVGPIPYFMPAELAPSRWRVCAQGFTVAASWLSAFFAQAIFRLLHATTNSYCLLVFALISGGLLAVMQSCLPETSTELRSRASTGSRRSPVNRLDTEPLLPRDSDEVDPKRGRTIASFYESSRSTL